jgi:hypothetical protein
VCWIEILGRCGGRGATVWVHPKHQRIGEADDGSPGEQPARRGHDGAARCLLAIEMSKHSWVIAAITPLSDKISRHTLKSRSLNGPLELVGRLRTQISHGTGQVVEVISCYEAGFDGFWLHRSLEKRGVRNHVIDPASLQVNRRARGAKTDRIDAKRLLRLLMAYLRGEPKGGAWRVCRALPKRMHDGRTARAIVCSRSVFSMSAASRDHARSTVFTIIGRCGRTG